MVLVISAGSFAASKRCNKHAAEAAFHARKITFARGQLAYGEASARDSPASTGSPCERRGYGKAAMIDILSRCLALALPLLIASQAMAEPETVFFKSADGETEIVAYLFKPATPGPHGAVVMLHGRAGPYSANVNGDCALVTRETPSICNAGTLSKRHAMWGEYWAARGYLALLPDSFGPRGKAHGFGRFSHDDPDRADVNEMTVRPLDAEGALAFLRARSDVTPGRIFLQGWSNGGSTALNVMIRQGAHAGFRAALAFYPGCGRDALLKPVVATPAPIAMFIGSDDEEVSPTICQHVAERSRAAGTPIDITLYRGVTHGFDDPGEKRQSVPENAAAKEDAMKRAIAMVEGMK
jgi:dienelactone hydrolase